jgi:hypothetical protein
MSIKPNNDFLSEENESESTPRKRRTKEEILKDKYPEYFALTEYQRKCLVATNYWRVLNGMTFIEVPEQDTHFHKYFDYRCFDLYKQKLKLQEKLKKLELEKPIYKTPKPEPVIEQKIEPIIQEPIKEVKSEVKDELKKPEIKPANKKKPSSDNNNQPTLF